MRLKVSSWGTDDAFEVGVEYECGRSAGNTSMAAQKAGSKDRKAHTRDEIVTYIAATYKEQFLS